VSDERPAAGCLAGYRVLELCAPWGQYCGKLLADLGADVVKIEPPGGDAARALGPFKDDRPGPDSSLFFAYYNTNKRSLVLDLGQPEGRVSLARLAATADALLETAEPAQAAAWGIDFATLHARNPRLVVTSLSGFGHDGPAARSRATGLVVFALSGLMQAIGEPEGPPVAAPGQIAFDLAAVDAAAGTLLALWARHRTGRGQHVDVAALEVLAAQPIPSLPGQADHGRHGQHNPRTAPSGKYACRDGLVELCIIMPAQWDALKELLGRPPELERPDWNSREGRAARLAELTAAIGAALRDWSVADVVAEGQRLRVPALPVSTVADFVAAPHAAARGFFVPADSPSLGAHLMPGAPYRLSEAGWALRRPAPRLGEHTAEVLGELERAASAGENHGGGQGPLPGSAESDTGRATPLARARIGAVAGAEAAAGGARQAATTDTAASLPLAGVRVLAFSTAFAGPTASRYLADYGAEVVKLESRRRPDNTRGFGGAYVEPSGVSVAPGFVHFNRNKRGVAVDMSQEKGRELVRRLVRLTDVVTENFSLRVLQGWGFDYDGLRAIRPDIILLDMQGLGRTGPLRDYITYGSLLHAYSGLTSLWGYSHGSFVDYVAAQHAVVAVLAALLHRERTGRGLHIDLGQIETAAALLGTAYLDYLVNGPVPGLAGNASPYHAPSGCYRCRADADPPGATRPDDAWCVIDVTSDAEWERFANALGHPDWTRDARYATAAGRLAAAAALDAQVAAWTCERSAADVEARLQAAGVPAAAVRAADAVPADPHLRARGFYHTVDQPILGALDYPGLTIHLSETPGALRRHAPTLGQDNAYVFGDLLGLSPAEIAQLTEEGVLA
jgi:crotonobetainyl-CoA:carnitine CoA-transferase CaiB-like acyl-CoA transferase